MNYDHISSLEIEEKNLINQFTKQFNLNYVSIFSLAQDASLRYYKRVYFTKNTKISQDENIQLNNTKLFELVRPIYNELLHNSQSYILMNSTKDLNSLENLSYILMNSTKDLNSLENLSYILMNSTKDLNSLEKFVKITNLLQNIGIKVPKIYSIKNGCAILQYLGNNNLKMHLANNNHQELFYYKNIVDILFQIYIGTQKNNIKLLLNEIEKYNNQTLINELNIFKIYLEYIKIDFNTNQWDEFIALFKLNLNNLQINQSTLVLRDLHAENIMLLNSCALQSNNSNNNRNNNKNNDNNFNSNYSKNLISNIKESDIKESDIKLYAEQYLIDYQDAQIGSVVYDLVSLLQDARRDLNIKNISLILKYFTEKFELSYQICENDYHILGLQRNLRILGVFARQYLRCNNDNYLQYIPRVLRYINDNLNHSANKKIKKFLQQYNWINYN
ncbi:MAG: hypothetical protein U1E31_00670 [Rickettsiales bacterium]